MKKTTIHFVRHGKTIFNHADIVQGWADSFLTPSGEAVVRQLGNYWKKEGKTFDAVYASDSGRTWQTSRILLETLGHPISMIVPMAEFREYNFGGYEGLRNPDAFERYLTHLGYDEHPGFTNTFLKEYYDAIAEVDRIDRGHMDDVHLSETNNDFVKRLLSGIKIVGDKAIAAEDANVLVVSHGMVLSTIYANLFLEEEGVVLPPMPNAAVTSFIYYENGDVELIAAAADLAGKNAI